MAKKVDINGFWDIKDNPLTKEGVFEYLGSQIDPGGKRWGLTQNRRYLVYRPLSEISKEETLKSFDGVPFIDEHDMLGEGCTPTDFKNIAGTIYNVRVSGTKMVGDFKIYSDNIKRAIMNGKKELSLGYRANFRRSPGIFNGIAYDFVQTGIVGNHVALVNCGRCGSDVRVLDKSIVCDSMPMEVHKMKNKEELKAVLDGLDEEKLAKAGEFLEQLTTPVTDSGEGDGDKDKDKDKNKKDGDKKDAVKDGEACPKCGKTPCECKDKCADKKDDPDKGKDKDGKKDAVKDEKPVTTQDAAGGEPPKNGAQPVLDEAAVRTDAIKAYKEAVKLHDELVPHIGEFVMDGMDTPQAVAEYGCKKLNINVNAGSEIATLQGFLAGSKGKVGKAVTMDEAPNRAKPKFDFKTAYLAN